MKPFPFFLSIFFAVAFLSSCKKDNIGSGQALQGTWQGKWGSGNQAPSYFLKFKMESNGNMQRLDEQNKVIATGTWALNGIEFECTYTHTDGQVHRIGGLYTDFDNTIVGRWGYSPSKANGGEIELVKQ